jgi:hypothetical protein
MDLATQRLMSGAAGAVGGATYIDDIFSTFVDTGTGSARTVVNNIDIADKGGLVWQKWRSGNATANDNNSSHILADTVRGTSKYLKANTTDTEFSVSAVGSFNSNGYQTGGNLTSTDNSGDKYVSYTFARQKGFFDIVTYTGSGSTQTISHSLESTPGMILVKRLDTSAGWGVYHRGQVGYDGGTKAEDYRLLLDSTTYSNNDTYWGDTAPTTTQFTVGDAHTEVNASGGNYVAYIFAHDEQSFGESADSSVIKCGNYTGNGSTNGPEVDVGWEPQWIMVKRTSGGTGLWLMADSMRGVVNGGNDPYLQANQYNGEYPSYDWIEFTPTGFKLTNTGVSLNSNGDNYVYTAIRRSDGYVGKPPELGTDVFNMVTGTTSAPAFVSGFPVDFSLYRQPAFTHNWHVTARLMGSGSEHTYLRTNGTNTEVGGSFYKFDFMNGWLNSTGWDSSYQSWMWKRHAGFDVVCYDGVGGGQTVSHSLNKVPEMIWIKNRDYSEPWTVGHKGLNGGTNPWQYWVPLNATDIEQDNTASFNDTAPTATQFTVGNDRRVDFASQKFMALLFASTDVSSVGSYTGNGSTTGPVITTGFAPRFLIIRRAGPTEGDNWNVFDTVRGFSSGNDPLLKINNSNAQLTGYDLVDPTSDGFQLVTTDSAHNSNGVTYIYYAHA